MLYPMAQIGLESNGSEGSITVANTRYRLQTEWHIGLNKETGYESESHFGKYFGQMQWLFPYVGWDFRKRTLIPDEKNLFGQSNTKNLRQVAHVGVEYTLPMLVIADGSIDSEGKLRFQLGHEDIGISKRLRFNFRVNTDKEYAQDLDTSPPNGLRYLLILIAIWAWVRVLL